MSPPRHQAWIVALGEARNRLADRIEQAGARLVRIVAPAGWGKSTLARLLAERAADTRLVEFGEAETPDDADAAIAELIADRPRFVVLDDLHAVLRGPNGPERVRRLFRGLPPGARIVITSRDALPADVLRGFAPHEIVAIGIDDLALDEPTRRAIIDAPGADEETVHRAALMTRGWPIAVFLFARFAREGRLAELLARDGTAPYEDLYAYVEREVLAELTETERRIVAAAIVLGEGSAHDLGALVGEPVRIAADRLVDGRLVLRRTGDRYRASPMAVTLFRRSARHLIAEISRTGAEAASRRGDALRAAELWLAGGDAVRAAQALDESGARARDRRYQRVAEALPLQVLVRTEFVFDALYGSARLRGRPWDAFDRVRTIAEALPTDADARMRASIQLALGILYRFVARFREADAALALAQDDADALPPHRAQLLAANRAAVAAVRGRTREARARWAAATLDDDLDDFRNERHELQFSCALVRGDGAALVRVGHDVLEDARLGGDTYEIAYGAMLRAFTTRLVEDRRGPGDMVGEIARAADLDPNDPDAVHFLRPTDVPPERITRWTAFTLADAAFEQADPATARRLLDLAIDGFDRIGMPHFQVSARLLASFVPGAGRARLLRQTRDIARGVDEPLFTASVEAIAAGRLPERGPFRALYARVERSRLLRGSRTLRLDVLRGRVTRAGEDVPLRARELELLVALAFARGTLSTDAIVERLWRNGERAGSSALRMSVHRLRRQLDDGDAVVATGDGYALGESIGTDLEEIEAVVPALARLPSLTEGERERLAQIFERLAVELPERLLRWEWLGPELARFEEYRHTAGLLLGNDALRSHRPLDALAAAETLLRFDSLDEPATELVVRALVAGGRLAEAARRARRYRERLAEELGAEPAIDLERHLRAP